MQSKVNYKFALEAHATDVQAEVDDLLFKLRHGIAYDVW